MQETRYKGYLSCESIFINKTLFIKTDSRPDLDYGPQFADPDFRYIYPRRDHNSNNLIIYSWGTG